MRISSRVLNRIANVCLVAALATLGTAAWYKYHDRPAGQAPGPTPGPPIQPGSNAPLVSGVSYASQEQLLLVFLSTACRYCEASVPF
jgi:hypothetical protein